MSKPKCLARLTNWDKTYTQIGPCSRASIVRTCKNIPQEGAILCEECMERPIESKYQTRMMHGLLTEPPPECSHLFGSSWYWDRLDKLGDKATVSEEWLAAAVEAQARAEEFCGPDAWKVQRPSKYQLEEMRRGKKALAAKGTGTAAGVAKAEVKKPVLAGTILASFPPIKKLYEESAKPIEKLPTDSIAIWMEELESGPIWRCANGMVFDVDTNGLPGEFIGLFPSNQATAE